MANEIIQSGIEELELSDPESLDPEDTSSLGSSLKPWDPGKIRITTKAFSLRDVVDQIVEHEIDLAPDYQRDFVWKDRQKTRLVESILLGIPLPAFYFNQAKDATYQVVDGVQRLSTISAFMQDRHVLQRADLEYLNDLDGRTYSELDPAAIRRFRSTQIVVHVIEPQTPDEVKYDIFGRVNTLGSPLSAQEIRHAMSGSQSRAFLKSLIELKSFDQATEWQFWRRDANDSKALVRDSGRMTNRELALRFCAFRRFSDSEYRQYPSLDAFLVEFTRRLDRRSERALPFSDQMTADIRDDFHRAMVNSYEVLGKAAFRRWPLDQKRRGPINRAVFEAQAIALSEYKLPTLLPRAKEIVSEFRKAFNDYDYGRAVTVGTGDPKAVSIRLETNRQILRRIIQ